MKDEGKIKDYLFNSFGWNVRFDSSDSLKKCLPYALLGAAEYAVISYANFSGVAIEPRTCHDFRTIRNLVDTIERKTGKPALLVLEGLDSYQRRVLIENRINFIVPYRQLFLPAFGILMNERGLGVRQSKHDTLSSVATAIIVNQLSKRNIQGRSVTQAAEAMGYSVKTLSLAVKELEERGLVSIRQEGRKKLLDFTFSPRELWNRTYPLADSPVEKRMFTVRNTLAADIGIKASDSALSELSMLSTPQQDVYAVYARNPRLKELYMNSNDGSAVIEIWKTDPSLTADNGIADIFSLALSYKEDDDPRITKEMNKLLAERL